MFLLSYYFNNIDSTHVVGEVGAGTGAFSMLVNLIVPNAKININELEQSHLTYINKIVMASSNLFKIENFELVKGDEKSTNFDENQMDKIIIRNSFHHFGKKEKMLSSIRNSLKQNGELFVFDPVKEKDSDGSMCKLALKKQEIIDLDTKNGFKLEDQMPGVKMSFFRFVKV